MHLYVASQATNEIEKKIFTTNFTKQTAFYLANVQIIKSVLEISHDCVYGNLGQQL